MRLRRPLPAVQGDTLHIVGVGDNRIGKLGDAATFQSDLKPLRFIWIVFTNMIVSVLTLFLMLPWAQVRAFRY